MSDCARNNEPKRNDVVSVDMGDMDNFDAPFAECKPLEEFKREEFEEYENIFVEEGAKCGATSCAALCLVHGGLPLAMVCSVLGGVMCNAVCRFICFLPCGDACHRAARDFVDYVRGQQPKPLGQDSFTNLSSLCETAFESFASGNYELHVRVIEPMRGFDKTVKHNEEISQPRYLS